MASALGCGDGGRVRASGGVALDQGAEHVQAPALPGLALLGKPALELLGVGQAKAVEERPAVERGRGGEQVETDVAQPRARQGDRSGKIALARSTATRAGSRATPALPATRLSGGSA